MIPLTRPDGSTLLVNPNRIETVEETPDTVITMADGKKLLVRETAEEVAARFLAHHRAVHVMPEGLSQPAEAAPVAVPAGVVGEVPASEVEPAAGTEDGSGTAGARQPASTTTLRREGVDADDPPNLDWIGLR